MAGPSRAPVSRNPRRRPGRAFRSVSDETGQPEGQFACHFYKFNPVMYDKCKKCSFTRHSDVKQHIVRCHSLTSPYCDRCWMEFSDQQEYSEHITQGHCQERPRPEELIREEVDGLGASRREDDNKEKWLGIWNLLFRGHPQPDSPYLPSCIFEEGLALIQPFVHNLLQQHSGTAAAGPVPANILHMAYQTYCHGLPVSRHPQTLNNGAVVPHGHAYQALPQHVFPNNNGDYGEINTFEAQAGFNYYPPQF
ncbi:unnamed protein product [Clonostachys rosea]|uniref:C2H2-type domain-containing protein n=1 Tax=Bionectria ochroleuca TaxID=29856 RepID=A0ABY6UDY5_BIOOC|nr:unnamed protein product [Clonostachys rosea]